jgi:hypothetical protein
MCQRLTFAMAGLSLAVAAASFALGWVIRAVVGVDI